MAKRLETFRPEPNGPIATAQMAFKVEPEFRRLFHGLCVLMDTAPVDGLRDTITRLAYEHIVGAVRRRILTAEEYQETMVAESKKLPGSRGIWVGLEELLRRIYERRPTYAFDLKREQLAKAGVSPNAPASDEDADAGIVTGSGVELPASGAIAQKN